MSAATGVAVAEAIKSADTKKTIVYGVIVLGVAAIVYFGVIRPVTNFWGLTDDKEDREGKKDFKRLSKAQTLSPAAYKKNPQWVTISSQTASRLASDAKSGKGLVYDNEDLGVGAITGAGSQINISYVAHKFQKAYGESLEGFLYSYLEPEDWSTIDNYVKTVKIK
jgi:hypothetical protein